MAQQTQIQLQAKMKMLDDVFHRTLIELERLELYLESERNNTESIITTALKTDRDLHDDYQRPPTKETFYGLTNLQCQALFFQTSFDDKETFENVVKYYLKDIFSWYGGRKESIEPNDVEKYFIPLSAVLCREIEEVSELSKIIKEYIYEAEDIENKSDSEKEESIKGGFDAWLKGSHQFEVDMNSFLAKGEEVKLTSHNRGGVNDGVRRLYKSFELLCNDKAPSLLLYKLVETYLPEIKDEVTEYTVESINDYFANKK